MQMLSRPSALSFPLALLAAQLVFGSVAGAQDTSLSISSDAGDSVGLGQSYLFTPADDSFTVSRNNSGGVSVFVNSGSESWSLDFAAAINAPLKAGVYGGVTQFPSPNITQAAMNVQGDGRQCSALTGSFEVKKIIYDRSGSVVAFWATFVQHCNGAAPALTGEIKYNADSTAVSVNQPPVLYAGPDQRVWFPNPANLSAIAGDDGLPNGNLTATWSVVSAPGEVIFGDPNALQTIAVFSVVGIYSLRLTVSDGELSASQVLVVSVVDPLVNSSIMVSTHPGAGGGQAQNFLKTLLDGDITAQINDFGGVSVQLNSGNSAGAWSVNFADGAQGQLQSGTYNGAVPYGNTPAGQPTLGLTSPNISCNMASGGFVVKEIVSGPNGTISAFWATFSIQCTAPGGTVTGEVRFNADIPGVIRNPPPVADAGPDQVIVLGSTMSLHGKVSDDFLPRGGRLTSSWSVLSGPGTVTFRNARSADTTAQFSARGRYLLRLTTSDGTFSGVSDMVTTVVTAKGTYNALVPALAGNGPPGFFTVTIGGEGAFSGALTVNARVYRIRGGFDGNGAWQTTIRQGRLPSLVLSLQINGDPAGVSVSLGDGTNTSNVSIAPPEQLIDALAGVTAAQAGAYTMMFPWNDPQSGAPGAYGTGSITVSSDGLVRVAAVLPDRSVVALGAALSPDGSFPFYSPLNGGQGSIAGNVQFEDKPTTDVDGALTWTQTVSRTAVSSFPLNLAGSRYTVPLAGNRIIAIGNAAPNADVQMSYPAPPAIFLRPVTLTTANTVAAPGGDQFTLKVVPASGTFTGSFLDAATRRRVTFSGVFLQKTSDGYGMFVGGRSTGPVTVKATGAP